jgi:hypothetical protein
MKIDLYGKKGGLWFLLGAAYVVLAVVAFLTEGRTVGIVISLFAGMMLLIGAGWYLGFNKFFRSD